MTFILKIKTKGVKSLLKKYFVFFPILAASQETNDKLEGVDVEEVCENRPGDEYFRLDTEGDCREVYRYVKSIL